MGYQNCDYTGVRISGNLTADICLIKNIIKNDIILKIRQLKLSSGSGFASNIIPDYASGQEPGNGGNNSESKNGTANASNKAVDCCLFYFDGMVSSELLNESVLKPLLLSAVPAVNFTGTLSDYIEKDILFSCEVKQTSSVADILRGIQYGDTALLIDGCCSAIVINTKGFVTRGISEPADERILQGPREGFGETAMHNLAMLRRKLQTPDLCIENIRIGRRTDTSVYICYLESLADRAALDTLKKRLGGIDIDGILDTNYLAELIRDHKFSLFKTTGSTERPDIAAARMLEGRIAVIVDGTPVAMTLPYLFSENFQSDEDYYLNWLVASVARIIRFLCFFIAVSVPAAFLSLITFHEQLLPTMFELSIAQARGGVPLSSFLECVIIIMIFEILKETGARMPQSLGHALGIVGGLVIGQAAVEARIISAPMLIAVALSGIAGLMIPRLKSIVFFGRLGFIVICAFFGIYGYLIGMTALFIAIFSLDSFGVDCTLQLLNPTRQGLKDIFWRAPWTAMKTRPDFNNNAVRAKNGENNE